MIGTTILLLGAFVAQALGQASNYGQCGGQTWTGATTCNSGWTCTYSNPFFELLAPLSATLLPNYYWIRAVADPNFHKYLQSNPLLSTGPAVLNSASTAGQFNIVNGKLVQLVGGGKLLYGVVETRADATVMKLQLSWSADSSATTGTFAWSGDALQWTISGITRPNASAWLVCANQIAFVNLGSYGYQTPAGCADQTIHYYNGATANT